MLDESNHDILERQNYGDNEEITGCQGQRGRKMNRWNQRGFLRQEKPF